MEDEEDEYYKSITTTTTEEEYEETSTSGVGTSVSNRSVRRDEERWWRGRERERARDTVIRFSGTLPTDKYVTGALHLQQGLCPFRFLATLFYLLHPFDFPAGKSILFILCIVHLTNAYYIVPTYLPTYSILDFILLISVLRYLNIE